MEKNQIEHINQMITEAIGRLEDGRIAMRGEVGAAWTRIREIVDAAGGRVAFALSGRDRRRNEEARRSEIENAPDEETRKFLETWRGPFYAAALRESGTGVTFNAGDGTDAYGFVDAVEVDGDEVRVYAYDEDSLVVDSPNPPTKLAPGDIADPMPVLLFLESRFG